MHFTLYCLRLLIRAGASVLHKVSAWVQQEVVGLQLQLMQLIPEQRSGPGISRALAVFVKPGASPPFHAEGCKGAITRCHGSRVAPPVQAQSVSKTHDRTGAYSSNRQQGTVDIWRWVCFRSYGLTCLHLLITNLSRSTGDLCKNEAPRAIYANSHRHVERALHNCRAAWMGDTASIDRHIAAGGAGDAIDAKGCTPLLMAAGYGRSAAVARLLQTGASSAICPAGTSPLHRCAR